MHIPVTYTVYNNALHENGKYGSYFCLPGFSQVAEAPAL